MKGSLCRSEKAKKVLHHNEGLCTLQPGVCGLERDWAGWRAGWRGKGKQRQQAAIDVGLEARPLVLMCARIASVQRR